MSGRSGEKFGVCHAGDRAQGSRAAGTSLPTGPAAAPRRTRSPAGTKKETQKKPGSRQQPQHNSCRASRLRPMLSTSSSCHDVLLSELILLLLTAPSRPLPKHAVSCTPGTAAQPLCCRGHQQPLGFPSDQAALKSKKPEWCCLYPARAVDLQLAEWARAPGTRGALQRPELLHPELLHPGCESFLP